MGIKEGEGHIEKVGHQTKIRDQRSVCASDPVFLLTRLQLFLKADYSIGKDYFWFYNGTFDHIN